MHIYDSTDDAPIVAWQWHEPSLRNITHLILSRAPDGPGRALDVGCGTGRVSLALAARGYHVDGIDVEARVIDVAARLAAARGAACSFRTGDFADPTEVEPEAYDLVVSSEVLEHVDDYQPLVDHMYAALKPGGTLVLSVPCDPARFSVLDEYAGHVRRFAVPQVEALLAPFEDARITVTGFPFYRLLTAAYLLALRLSSGQHSNEDLWRRPSTRVVASLLYPLVRFDNALAFTRRGDYLVASATKPRRG